MNSAPWLLGTAPQVDTYGSASALAGVLNGTCAGAVIPSTEAAWLLAVNDTEGSLCGLIPMGAPAGEETNHFMFSALGAPGAVTAAQLTAINLVRLLTRCAACPGAGAGAPPPCGRLLPVAGARQACVV